MCRSLINKESYLLANCCSVRGIKHFMICNQLWGSNLDSASSHRWWWLTRSPMRSRSFSVPRLRRWTSVWFWLKPSAASITENPWPTCSATSPWMTNEYNESSHWSWTSRGPSPVVPGVSSSGFGSCFIFKKKKHSSMKIFLAQEAHAPNSFYSTGVIIPITQ